MGKKSNILSSLWFIPTLLFIIGAIVIGYTYMTCSGLGCLINIMYLFIFSILILSSFLGLLTSKRTKALYGWIVFFVSMIVLYTSLYFALGVQ